MSWNYVDVNEPRWDSTRPPPRGLLPVPPEVEDLLAVHAEALTRQGRIQFMTPEAWKRQRDQYTLEYYYDGQIVAARTTSQGIEVVAVGLEEIGEVFQGMSQEEVLKIRILTA